MGDDVAGFMRDFGALVRMALEAQPRSARGRELVDTLSAHLGAEPGSVPVVIEEVAPHRFVDADIVLGSLTADGRCVGIGGGDHRHHMSFSDMVQQSEVHPNFPLSQPDYANLPVGPDEQRQAVALGLRLFERDGVPLALLQRNAEPRYGRQSASLEVMCADAAVVSGFLAEFRRRMQRESVMKGQVLSFTVEDFGPSSAGVTFHHRPALDAADVILPEGLLERVGEHALGIAVHRQALLAAGQHLKRGILLYGPPGTGKTHTVRYLLSASAGTTAIILTGGTLQHVGEAARTARALQPSIVVLEDCDLIAEDRSLGHGPQPLLFEVLDAMDGLDDDADVTFVLTTNRVDMLERALAQRPGRVDLAVEVPLPGEHERAALLRLYARGLAFSEDAVGAASGRTGGTTASFMRELVRRAVLAAALQGTSVADGHLLAAVDELMADGASLTRSLLGSNGPGQEEGVPAGPGGSFGWVPGAPPYSGGHPPAYGSSLSLSFDGEGFADGGYSEDGFPDDGVEMIDGADGGPDVPPGDAGR
ncbi:AAA family ATPase [Arthrobacter agilis]|uniref:AAA family ATPase n=1 Tax=Arthrobacter agilis TaxID=37921 RepID=UPI00278234DC|nr:AAA family ATPase [Arthrobacter agilis]MDQ0736537.1 DNA polymerase III delta prime subunit [Arthrobacter agilis]